MTKTIEIAPPPTSILRGWKQICAFVGFKDYRAAKKHLEGLGLLKYERKRPRLSVELYQKTLAEADAPKEG